MKSKNFILSILVSVLSMLANAANIESTSKDMIGNVATINNVGEKLSTTRFASVNMDCIRDNMTGLIWTKNANLFVIQNWANAKTKVAEMNTTSSATGYHLCGYSDWRLPNQNELVSLFKSAAVRSNQVTWLISQGFTNVQPDSYWSSSVGGLGAWFVNMSSGYSSSLDVYFSFYVWPVRGG